MEKEIFELMEDAMNKLSSKFQFNGKHIYWLMQRNHINMGDESSLTSIIWTQDNPLQGNDDESFYENDEYLIMELRATLNDIMKNQSGWKMKGDMSGFTLEYESTSSDYIRLQSSDHCIYLIQLNSGQY